MPGKTGNEKSPFFYFSNYEFASNRVTLFLERFKDERAHAPPLGKSVPFKKVVAPRMQPLCPCSHLLDGYNHS